MPGVLAGLCVALLFLGPLAALNLWAPAKRPMVSVVEKTVSESQAKTPENMTQERDKQSEKAVSASPSKAPNLKEQEDLVKKNIKHK